VKQFGVVVLLSVLERGGFEKCMSHGDRSKNLKSLRPSWTKNWGQVKKMFWDSSNAQICANLQGDRPINEDMGTGLICPVQWSNLPGPKIGDRSLNFIILVHAPWDRSNRSKILLGDRSAGVLTVRLGQSEEEAAGVAPAGVG
jgi:hypothetical protein